MRKDHLNLFTEEIREELKVGSNLLVHNSQLDITFLEDQSIKVLNEKYSRDLLEEGTEPTDGVKDLISYFSAAQEASVERKSYCKKYDERVFIQNFKQLKFHTLRIFTQASRLLFKK